MTYFLRDYTLIVIGITRAGSPINEQTKIKFFIEMLNELSVTILFDKTTVYRYDQVSLGLGSI